MTTKGLRKIAWVFFVCCKGVIKMKVYLVVETKGAGEFEEKHLRAVSLNEDMAYKTYSRLKYAKRGFNEPVPSYFIEETDLDEIVDILL